MFYRRTTSWPVGFVLTHYVQYFTRPVVRQLLLGKAVVCLASK